MNKKHGRLIDALDRVETFLQTNSDRMAAVITSEAHRKFSASRERMRNHGTTQDLEARVAVSTTATKRTLRRRLLRKHMQPISVIAHAELANVAELAAFALPARRTQFRAFVTAGYGMAKAAKLHEAVFLGAGCTPGFIERLAEAAAALEQGIDARGQRIALRVQATAGLRKEASVARKQLRVLNALVRAAVEDNDDLLDQWNSLRRIVAVATSARTLEREEPAPAPVSEAPPAGPTGPIISTKEVAQAA